MGEIGNTKSTVAKHPPWCCHQLPRIHLTWLRAMDPVLAPSLGPGGQVSNPCVPSCKCLVWGVSGGIQGASACWGPEMGAVALGKGNLRGFWCSLRGRGTTGWLGALEHKPR